MSEAMHLWKPLLILLVEVEMEVVNVLAFEQGSDIFAPPQPRIRVRQVGRIHPGSAPDFQPPAFPSELPALYIMSIP